MRRMLKMKDFVLILGICLTAFGCQKTLYKDLQEKEANEMMVLLMESGISSSKDYNDRSGRVSLKVDEGDVTRSVSILSENGYPKDSHTNLGEVFAKTSLISSPTEEHARYTYALSEDLSQTLSELDGVIHAKVHLVLPQMKGKVRTQASAAVFIKHSESVKMANFIPQIKLLVQGSVEELKYEDVNVALFPSLRDVASQKEKVAASQGFMAGKLGSFGGSWLYVLLAIAGLLALVALYNVYQLRQPEGSMPAVTRGGDR